MNFVTFGGAMASCSKTRLMRGGIGYIDNALVKQLSGHQDKWSVVAADIRDVNPARRQHIVAYAESGICDRSFYDLVQAEKRDIPVE